MANSTPSLGGLPVDGVVGAGPVLVGGHVDAEALMEHGMPERGVTLMRAYLQKHPDSLDARLELALLLVKSKQFTEAEKLLNSIPAKQRSPLVDYYHARALIGMARQNDAVPYLQKASRKCRTLWRPWPSWPSFTSSAGNCAKRARSMRN